MSKPLAWIKSNKLTTVLIIAIAYLLYKQFQYYIPYTSKGGYGGVEMMYSEAMPPVGGYPSDSVRTDIDLASRMVVKNSYFSLLVKNVNESISSIKSQAESLGGFMVSSSITTPEGLTNGDISVRVPKDKLPELENHLRGLAVKVVSESTSGYDVTDQYFDIEERLATLETTKAKYEQILNSATNVDDILRVTEAIVQIQDQIDSLKGDAQYLKQTSKTALVTVYLSTDELQLPYAPEQLWRPQVVFKMAVRALVGLVRLAGTAVIWVAVFGAIWIPLVLLYKHIAKRFKRK